MSVLNPRLAVAVATAGLLISLVPVSALAQAGQMQQIQYGEIVSATQAVVQKQMTGGTTHTGSTVGAIAGATLAKRGDRWLGGLVGGAVGGAIGRSAEKRASRVDGWDLIIRLDRGGEVAIQLPHRKEQFREGDKVRILMGGGGADVQRVK